MSPCYRVRMAATAQVECTVVIDAPDEMEARSRATAAGDHCWDLIHGSVEGPEITEVETAPADCVGEAK